MSSFYTLSEGVLKDIMAGGQIPEPIIQVLGIKKIPAQVEAKERHRVLISDGKYSISFAMLTSQACHAGVAANCVVKLKKYITSLINNVGKGDTRVVLILDLEVLETGDQVGGKIGSPVALSNESKAAEPSTSSGAQSLAKSNIDPQNIVMNRSICDARIVNPISSLSPYQNKWVIKARVMNKSDVRTWSNSRGEGKLFSMDLADETGEIRVTAFKDAVDKFYDYVQIDKVYYISKCQLKAANAKFSTLKNDYEMTMSNETIVEECTDDDGTIPQTKYEFQMFDKVAELDAGVVADVIGVCKAVSDLQTFTSKTTNRELRKREVTLIDQSKTAIVLTLWGSQADSFDGANDPVVVIKAAKVGEFGGGKNLSTTASSQMKINPDIPECYRIKGWYDSEGRLAEVKNISERTGLGNFQTPWLNFKEVQDQGLGHSERGDYYQSVGTILLVRSENAIYKACPTDECNKKIVDLGNGMYRCEKCDRDFPNFKYRLLVSMNIGDWSGNQWVSMFSTEAEKILGRTSQEVGEALEIEQAAKIFDDANFKQFVFKCRAKMETFNDEERLKTVVVRVDPVNFVEHNAHLTDEIQKFID